MAIDIPLPEDLVAAALELTEELENRRIAYALIGGVAAGYRSLPRFTEDLDLILHIPQIALPSLLEALQQRGFTFDLMETIRRWGQDHLAVLSYRGIRVDWLNPSLPCYQHVIDTARPENWLGASVRIATTESLIVTKLLAWRTQDQVDIEHLLAANRGQLDLDYIRREWQAVADLDDPRWLRFELLQQEFYQPPPAK